MPGVQRFQSGFIDGALIARPLEPKDVGQAFCASRLVTWAIDASAYHHV